MGTVQWHAFQGTAVLEDPELAEWLEEQPVLCQAQADDQHLEVAGRKVWVSRVGRLDGMPCDDGITVERLDDGKWVNGGREDLIAALLSDGRAEAVAAAQRQMAMR